MNSFLKDFNLQVDNKVVHNIVPAKLPSKKTKDKLCYLCSFTAFTNSKLQRYIDIVHHKRRDLQCDLCDYRAATITNLGKHRRQMHERLGKSEQYSNGYARTISITNSSKKDNAMNVTSIPFIETK